MDQLVGILCQSRSKFHRKIKALTGHSTTLYIRLIRQPKAKELLAIGDLNVSEVAYRVGSRSPVNFSQVFKKTFGESPSENRKKLISPDYMNIARDCNNGESVNAMAWLNWRHTLHQIIKPY